MKKGVRRKPLTSAVVLCFPSRAKELSGDFVQIRHRGGKSTCFFGNTAKSEYGVLRKSTVLQKQYAENIFSRSLI